MQLVITTTVTATINYGFKYSGSLSENEVQKIINEKYYGNLWMALRDDFIDDIDWEEVDEVLNGKDEEAA